MSHAPASEGSRVLPSRRLVLRGAWVAAVGSVLGGCHAGGGAGTPSATSPLAAPGSARTSATTPVDADISLLTRAIAEEEALLGFCTAAARRFPSQRAPLRGLVPLQQAHVARLRGSLSHLRPPVTRTSRRVPLHVGDLTAALAEQEREVRDDRMRDCLAATSGLLAELFGSVSASHAVSLRALTPTAPSLPASPPRSVPDVSLLAPCLAAEFAAVYGYALLGGVLAAAVSEAPLAAATSSYEVHRERRDALLALFAAAGRRPPAAEPAYEMPFAVSGPTSAGRLARYLEARCAAVYLRAIGTNHAAGRVFVSATLVDCATRGAGWGAAPTAFPGLAAG